MKHKPIIMYDICDRSADFAPTPSIADEWFHSRDKALRALKQLRRQYPMAYLAKIVHAPCRETLPSK